MGGQGEAVPRWWREDSRGDEIMPGLRATGQWLMMNVDLLSGKNSKLLGRTQMAKRGRSQDGGLCTAVYVPTLDDSLSDYPVVPTCKCPDILVLVDCVAQEMQKVLLTIGIKSQWLTKEVNKNSDAMSENEWTTD